MANPDRVKRRPEVPSEKRDIDLTKFNAVSTADNIVNGARNLADDQDIHTYTRQALTALPFSAKWPTYNELYRRNIQAEDAARDARLQGTEYTQDPVEAAVSSYAEKLYFPIDKERISEELTLRKEIERSRKNFVYFSDFQKMIGRAERGVAFIALYDGEWQRIQEIHDERKAVPDDGEVVQNWVKLRSVLDAERTFERRAMNASGVGSHTLHEQSNNYARILSTVAEERSRIISEVKDLVATISEVDPILTAEILWKGVLTADEKDIISKERGKFRKVYALAAEASYFTDYQDPVCQAFIDHAVATADRGLSHGWPSQLAALERPTDPIERILIGDYSRIPHQTQAALEDRSTEGPWEIKDALKFKKSNSLQRYVTDVALVLLYTDIAVPPQQ